MQQSIACMDIEIVTLLLRKPPAPPSGNYLAYSVENKLVLLHSSAWIFLSTQEIPTGQYSQDKP